MNMSKVSEFDLITSKIAKKSRVDWRDLTVHALLHLPRFSDEQLRTRIVVANEVNRLAARIKELRSGYEYLEHFSGRSRLERTMVEQVDETLAKVILERFHYIGTYRKNSTHVGVFSYEKNVKRIAGLTTISEFDLEHVKDYLPREIERSAVKVLSRIYSFNWVPKNFGSYMLGRVFDFIRSNKPETELLLTYLNPNLGFKGATYRASNWSLFAEEEVHNYIYLDKNYITLRALVEAFATDNIELLKTKLGDRLSFSLQPLEPLKIYRYFLYKHEREKYERDERICRISKIPSIA